MNITFNERKATQAAAFLLRLRGGAMSYMKLIKLLYLADRTALVRWGRPLTTDNFVSMNRGPVLSHVLDLVTCETMPGEKGFWAQYISEPVHYEVRLNQDPGTDELSQAEEELLAEVFREHGRKSRWELVDLTHQLPEWQNPLGGAIPITYRDILRAEGKTEWEIAAIEEELANVALMEKVLGGQ
ncbi:Panacea domain-containing protein [Fontisphaera persica]|uniref:Panacea domain-containing protein n=1 Tax=Fontisphaera persica TaxID=2974023 RepID=UPI0024C09598|nr:Panacea domain-containing protein [Fontisphaera persica]WCJ59360.1 Panacea domain-containing protein [Fontisphaera persica]